MSRQDDRGIWTVPASQVEKFNKAPINFDQLVADCLKSMERVQPCAKAIKPKLKQAEGNRISVWHKEIKIF